AGTITLFVMGLRPFNIFGYALGASFAMAGIAALIMVSALGLTMYPSGPGLVAQPTALAALTDTPQPSATLTSTPIPLTATATITATSTAAATATLSPSPNPTAVQARVRPNEFGGVLVRAEPDYAAPVVKSLLNDSMVEILPDDQQQGNTTWVKVKTTDGIIGWIVRALLMTATPPAP
ncbi:MAG: SH3 domain-containing protein, partial [Anaerolineaceae bacterium]